MPLGLTNASATFQRLMCHIFKKFLRQFLEVYVDNLCLHLRNRMDHFDQLKLIFDKCHLYHLCLNPDKCVFMVRQGKILGHIVSKNGISIEKEKIKVILQLPRTIKSKQVQGFMGYCGYYQRFIF